MTELETKIKIHEHILQEWRIFSFALVLPLLFSGFLVFASDLTPASVLSLTNVERQKQNLPPLSESKALNKAAELKAADMIKNDYFAHTSPAGVTPWYWIKEAGYQYQFAGENLAINFSTAGDQSEAWMNSKTHRENILNKQYTEMGVAVVNGQINGKTSFVTVALFGTPLAAPVTKNSDSESVAAIPTVKGVQTKVTENVLPPVFLPKNALEKIRTLFLQHETLIVVIIDALTKSMFLVSLAAPGIVFLMLGLHILHKKEQHQHSF